jgi:two-component system, OmpR family, KDP operon response regulator KdpE
VPPFPRPLSSARGPSSVNCGPEAPQVTCTSTFWVPFLNSTSPGWLESSTHQPATGTPARTGCPPVQLAYTVPATVGYSPVAADAGAVEDGDVVPVGVAVEEVAATGEAPVDADASTRDTARKPRPTAAAAEAVQAAPRRTGRLIAADLMPGTLLPAGLRQPQDEIKDRFRCTSTRIRDASVRGVAQLLVVEDDERIRTALIRALRERGHTVSSAGTALAGLRQAVEERPDLVVLDLGLPDLDGHELLRMLRAVSAVPVVVATARDDDDSVVRALNAGADDYVLKPFRADQLEARIRAVLRRAAGSADPASSPVTVGPLTVEPRSRRVTYAGRPVELSPKEFDLLAYLAARAGAVVTRRELLSEVWQLPYGGSDKTVDVHTVLAAPQAR